MKTVKWIGIGILVSPGWLAGQMVVDTDPAPGSYSYVYSTGTNSVTMGAGVDTAYARSFDSSSFTQSGGESTWNYAYGSSSFTQSGGESIWNYANDSSSFYLTGGSLSNIVAWESSEIHIWAQEFAGSDLTPGSTGQATYFLSDLPTTHSTNWDRASFNVQWADGTSEGFTFYGESRGHFLWTGSLNLYDTDFFAPGSTTPLTPVPEPQAVGLLAVGLMGAGLWWRRRRQLARAGA